ncbi:3-hydroxyacyl-CoA dehydrogenase NAD-binding domain-containing protein [Sphingobium sp.]|jgi:3-hydroxyacyl-CoA dehydrogenase|uniref:3-hydroxyacyl-CoA dehydrogenase NAD-binding domain-containing protein n=2 Tax=Pseudomonadota TaxID=1224 RepID=UPI00257D1D5C|nr:3-hydroxyacyl-CoA dehydrogenase NAD-binding domain-containing protein [Sphingobium sp.]MBR2270384.1 enoyl-CoA hydratase/isomerase family protein [Sphingobium sp.]
MQINSPVQIRIVDEIAIITVDSPPVNALSAAVRDGLDQAIRSALDDPMARGILLTCAGRTFIAGADISEFGKPLTGVPLHDVLDRIEGSPKPVLAAIHGTALGGGLETALVCDYRVATPSARLGLPEVALGLLPGAGGTQRLPRLIGVEAALDMMVFGKPVSTSHAQAMGLIDAIMPEDGLIDGAIAYLRERLDAPVIKIRDRTVAAPPALFDGFRQQHRRSFKGFRAPENIVKAVEAAVTLPFDEGMKRESDLFWELMHSRESAAQRYFFFAERLTAKVPDLPDDRPFPPISHVGVIGAGTMGGGIAMNFLNVGIPVTIVEQEAAALTRGVDTIRRNYQATVDKGRLSVDQMDARMALLTPTLDLAALGDADLVIEAVFEKMVLKQEIFARLDQVARPDAILATNTSFLDIDAMAGVTSRPERVVGLHFFSPANVMKLLEVVRGARTAPDVVARAMAIGRKIGKVAVLSRVCDGFIANRMMTPRMTAAQALLLEGPMPWDIDRVMMDYGFAMGPFAMLDLVGLDVIGWDAAASRSSSIVEILCEEGRWGQKKGAGYYEYDERRRPTPSPHVEQVIRDFAARAGHAQRRFTDAEIMARLLYPVVNEGAKLLEEGIAIRASDVDVALIHGYGWPLFTGGPLFWADGVGLGKIADGLEAMGIAPAPLLRSLAASGRSLHNHVPAATPVAALA